MKLSFDKFLALTMTLAAGASLAAGCTVEDSDNDKAVEGSAGTEDETAGTGGSRDRGQAGEAGEPSSDQGGTAGTPSDEGSAGTPSDEGEGVGGTPSSEGVGGSGGTPSSEGVGGTPSSEGVGGTPSSEGGSAGSAGTPSSEGMAGTPSGEGGSAGSAGTPSGEGMAGTPSSEGCLSGAPADEGGGVDCLEALPYANEICPDPSGEGMAPLGVSVCWQYASERQDAVAVLVDCLQNIDDSDVCGDEHTAAVDACLSDMKARTCPSSSAEAACENIAGACDAVSVDQCVAEISMMSDYRIESIEYCAGPSAEGVSLGSPVCAYQLQSCAGDPVRYYPVEDACAQIKSECAAIDADECATRADRLDYYEDGQISDAAYYYGLVNCMQTELEMTTVTCVEAFTDCTATG